MDPIVLAAGTALVSVMATDAWQQAKEAATAVWGRIHPDRADAVEAELDGLRAGILTARQHNDHDSEEALVGVWRSRFQQLLTDEPATAVELRQLLDEHLAPALAPGERTRVGSVVMKAEARDNARVYMAGRDQHVTGP